MYIDSNIFIFAATDKGKLGEDCREIIRLISEQKIGCAASFLVLDEVVWILKKYIGKPDAIKIIKAMLSLPIRWIEIDKTVIIRMIDLYGITKEPIVCKGRVNWVFVKKDPSSKDRTRYDTGVEFSKIKEKDVNAIKKLIVSIASSKK